MKIEFSQQIFEKYSYIKFHENVSSRSRVFPCGRTDGRTDKREDRQTDMTKLIVAFRNFANAPKNYNFTCYFVLVDRLSQIEGIWEQGAEENIWAKYEGCNGRLEKTVYWEASWCIFLAKCYYDGNRDDEIKGNETGGTSDKHGREEKCIKSAGDNLEYQSIGGRIILNEYLSNRMGERGLDLFE